jgi:hypothetical protein
MAFRRQIPTFPFPFDVRGEERKIVTAQSRGASLQCSSSPQLVPKRQPKKRWLEHRTVGQIPNRCLMETDTWKQSVLSG